MFTGGGWQWRRGGGGGEEIEEPMLVIRWPMVLEYTEPSYYIQPGLLCLSLTFTKGCLSPQRA